MAGAAARLRADRPLGRIAGGCHASQNPKLRRGRFDRPLHQRVVAALHRSAGHCLHRSGPEHPHGQLAASGTRQRHHLQRLCLSRPAAASMVTRPVSADARPQRLAADRGRRDATDAVARTHHGRCLWAAAVGAPRPTARSFGARPPRVFARHVRGDAGRGPLFVFGRFRPCAWPRRPVVAAVTAHASALGFGLPDRKPADCVASVPPSL